MQEGLWEMKSGDGMRSPVDVPLNDWKTGSSRYGLYQNYRRKDNVFCILDCLTACSRGWVLWWRELPQV